MHNTNTKGGSCNKPNYKVRIDAEKYVFNESLITKEDILVKVGCKYPTCYDVYQKFKGCEFEKMKPGKAIDLSLPGVEKFTVKPSEIRRYTLDDEPEMTDTFELSANQILENGGLVPVSDYYLIEYDSNGNEISHKDNPEASIILNCPGSDFVSIFRGEVPVS